jgi:hypothetical protein
VSQPALPVPTPAVVATVAGVASPASIVTPSTSQVLGVQYSRLAATGSDPLPLGRLALGLLLLGSVMVRTTRQPA